LQRGESDQGIKHLFNINEITQDNGVCQTDPPLAF